MTLRGSWGNICGTSMEPQSAALKLESLTCCLAFFSGEKDSMILWYWITISVHNQSSGSKLSTPLVPLGSSLTAQGPDGQVEELPDKTGLQTLNISPTALKNRMKSLVGKEFLSMSSRSHLWSHPESKALAKLRPPLRWDTLLSTFAVRTLPMRFWYDSYKM